jgi:hypothetical protein
MARHSKRGRPIKPLSERQNQPLLVMLRPSEKQTFKDASGVAGIGLSTWVRERLRQAAIRELESAAMPIAFLKQLPQNEKVK